MRLKGRTTGGRTPVAPVGPVKPVAPVAPVAPIGPVAPVAPVKPIPVAPVTPMPVAPVAPMGPLKPLGPRGPLLHLTGLQQQGRFFFLNLRTLPSDLGGLASLGSGRFLLSLFFARMATISSRFFRFVFVSI
ncbi:hypothetical protein NV379_14045 [Paenibacillus sp. N1-5-1-14]|nr:hypothetical protein [Paenibacillus radicibacter]